MADLQFLVDYKTLTSANQELLKMGSTAQKSAAVFERAFRKVESANKKALSDVNSKIAFSKRMEAQHRKQYASQRADAVRLNQEYDAQVKASAAQAAAEDRLRNKFVAGHKAQTIYSKELNDIAQARKLDIITAEEQTEAVQRLNLAMKNGTGAFNSYGNGMVGGTKKQSKFGVVTQQTGYQVGDFLVQIQSGANPMMAFGQQATQLVGVMGLFGKKMVIAGAALGIIIPLVTAVAGYMLRAKKANDKTSESVEELESRIKSLDSTLSDYINTKKALEAGLSPDEFFVSRDIETQTKAVKELSKEAAELTETLQAQQYAGGNSSTFGLWVASLVSDTTTAGQAASRLIEVVDKLSEAQSRLNKLQSKQAEERFKEFSDTRRELLEELEIMRTISAEGENSSAHKSLALEQEIEARKRGIDAQRESGDLTVAQAESLKRLVEEALRFEDKMGLSTSAAKTLNGVLEKFTVSHLLTELDSLNTKLGTAIFNGGKFMSVIGSRVMAFAESLVTSAKANRELDLMERAGQGAQYGAGQLAARRLLGEGYTLPEGPKGRKPKATAGEKAEDYLRKLTLENKLKRDSIGISEEAARILEITTELQKKKQPVDNKKIEALVKEEMITNKLIEKYEMRQGLIENAEGAMATFIDSIVDGTQSIGDAFKSMLSDILKQIWQQTVSNPISEWIGGAIGGFFGSANGNVFSNGSHVQAFANGGVVGGPTMFPMNGGKTGLMGEAGPEAIMPLKRGANGKLGVEASGGGGATVSQNFYFTANGDESVKRIIQQEAPRIASLTQKQIMDQRKRGGSMKATFG